MNKKEARRKKHEADKKKSGNILDSPIIGGDDDEFDDGTGFEEEETLLGNLAPVKHIPMLPWGMPLIFPLDTKTFNLAAEADSWLVELFREISEKDEDLIGFLPIVNVEGGTLAVKETVDAGLGIAMQVREVKATEIGTNSVKLQAICRFEVTGFASKGDKCSNVNVRWFEDDEEPDEILRPLYERHMKIVERVSKMRGGLIMRLFQKMTNHPKYERHSGKYASFMFIDTFEDWFTRKEQVELLFLTSTAERYQRVYERAMKKLPALDNKWMIERRTKNN